jgi:2-polyprenyl-6-methoxyphenol hydroxylase-like FAD-dependent oxidoreductase
MTEPGQDGVLIIGAGIGGLATAIALRQAGIPAQVFEQRASAGELGAGLTLWTNAMHALDRLGLADAVRARGRAGLGGTIRTWRGAPLQRITAADLERTFGSANVAIHRADLGRCCWPPCPPGCSTWICAWWASSRMARACAPVSPTGRKPTAPC